jgi:hypothetical protein
MKKFFAILAIVALASCGGSSDSATEKDTANKEEAAPQTETAPSVDTIRVKNAAGTADSFYVVGADTTWIK